MICHVMSCHDHYYTLSHTTLHSTAITHTTVHYSIVATLSSRCLSFFTTYLLFSLLPSPPYLCFPRHSSSLISSHHALSLISTTLLLSSPLLLFSSPHLTFPLISSHLSSLHLLSLHHFPPPFSYFLLF